MLEINYRKKNEKNTKYTETTQHVLKTQQVNEEIRKYLETNENGNNTSKSMKCSKISSNKAVYSNIGLPKETRKISDKQPKLSSEAISKIRKSKA